MHRGKIREKPLTEAEAREFIKSYGDAPAVTVGACVCACLDTGVQLTPALSRSAGLTRLVIMAGRTRHATYEAQASPCDAGETYEDVDINTVHFDPIPDETISRLIAEGSVYDCAGGALPLPHERTLSFHCTLPLECSISPDRRRAIQGRELKGEAHAQKRTLAIHAD